MTFRIGMKVCCINDDWGPHPLIHLIDKLPRKGEVYCIAGFKYQFDVTHLVLDGISMPVGAFVAFEATNFRPLIERSTDISALKALLNPNNHTLLPEDVERFAFEVVREALR